MDLVYNWRTLLKRAWSIRLIVAAGLLSGFEVILPLFFDMIPHGVFAVLSMVVAAAAFVARLVAQKGLVK